MQQILQKLAVMTTVGFSLLGCTASSPISDYETVTEDPNRDTATAQREHGRAIELIAEEKYEEAEKRLKKALSADITYGLAHNSLGKVYYHQSKLYLAAWEFQYAIKLMPSQPEPRNNLGLVFESVGKLDEAITAYDEAVELEPDNPELIGNLVRARVRRGDRDEHVQTLLADLILRDTRPEWVQWARTKLALIGPTTDPDAGSAPAETTGDTQ